MNRITKVLLLFTFLLPGCIYGINKRQRELGQDFTLAIVGLILGWNTPHSSQMEQTGLDVDSTSEQLGPSKENKSLEVLIAKVDHQSTLDATSKLDAGKKENEIS